MMRKQREKAEKEESIGCEDVLVPITGDRAESKYDVTTILGQKHTACA